ncbi:hypothetical protein O3M35_007180 [Rhynocoris fuscipes]|uniref:Uncharacterized protein n=1 Tax=Rhynocoris fuscipes TaxID=488301 RepID=A0AAW1D8F2_9HEMI
MSKKVCTLCDSREESDEMLPLISDSLFFGPSIDENILYLISFLPSSWLEKIGFLHERKQKESDYEKENIKEMDLSKWLRNEYVGLAKEVEDRGCCLSEFSDRVDTPMLESRKFVLNRLAELMEKKSEIEKSWLSQRKRCD